MQMTMFDPRQTPTATAAMLADRDLRRAVVAMRPHGSTAGWPYVEAIEGRLKAWAVDDRGTRYVLVGAMIYELSDLEVLNPKTQVAARAVFARLDEQVAA
jgi:hypothetical protein